VALCVGDARLTGRGGRNNAGVQRGEPSSRVVIKSRMQMRKGEAWKWKRDGSWKAEKGGEPEAWEEELRRRRRGRGITLWPRGRWKEKPL
jgi:hypothetical protein